MRCETSLFSLTLYKKHLTRYWPMWAVWLAGWLLAMPVSLWSQAQYNNASTIPNRVVNFMNGDWYVAAAWAAALAAPVAAAAVFFHLFRAPATNFVGALPMRREGVFLTAFAGGYTILAAPLILVTLVTLLVEWGLGTVEARALLAWLLGSLLVCFFWFSFATLCCAISGNMVAAVCFYGIFNSVFLVMYWLIQGVLSEFLYGFSKFSDRVGEVIEWMTPIQKLSATDHALAGALNPVGRLEMLWMYAAVGFLMALAALGLHHIRKNERSGDLIAFVPIRWVFRVSVTLCGGLSLGMLLTVIFSNGSFGRSNGLQLAAWCAVAAVISRYVAEMLLAKSFRVFKAHWRGALLGALCFVVAICAIDMDWIGYTSRVPSPGQVRSAWAEFHGRTVDPVAEGGIRYDAETVRELIELHQYLVDNRETEGDCYVRVELVYDLGLTSMRRVYNFNCRRGSRLAQLQTAAAAAGTAAFDIPKGAPGTGFLHLEGYGMDLSLLELDGLWEAVKEDVEAGRYRAAPEPREENADWEYIEFGWFEGYRTEHSSGSQWQIYYLQKGDNSVNAAIKRLDLRRKIAENKAAREEEATTMVTVRPPAEPELAEPTPKAN